MPGRTRRRRGWWGGARAKTALDTVVIFIITRLCLASPLVLATVTRPVSSKGSPSSGGDGCICQQLQGIRGILKQLRLATTTRSLVSQVQRINH